MNTSSKCTISKVYCFEMVKGCKRDVEIGNDNYELCANRYVEVKLEENQLQYQEKNDDDYNNLNRILFVDTSIKIDNYFENNKIVDIEEENFIQDTETMNVENMSEINKSKQNDGRASRNIAPSSNQLEMLVKYMEGKVWLARGHARTANARIRTRRAWAELAMSLNSSGTGCIKTREQWCKYWKDKKGAIRRKVNQLNVSQIQLDQGDIPELTETELKILSIIGGGSTDPLQDVTVVMDESSRSNETSATPSQYQASQVSQSPTETSQHEPSYCNQASQPKPSHSQASQPSRRRPREPFRRRSTERPRPFQRKNMKQDKMAHFIEQFIEIEETKAEAEFKMAEAITAQANNSSAVAQALNRIADVLAEFLRK